MILVGVNPGYESLGNERALGVSYRATCPSMNLREIVWIGTGLLKLFSRYIPELVTDMYNNMAWTRARSGLSTKSNIINLYPFPLFSCWDKCLIMR